MFERRLEVGRFETKRDDKVANVRQRFVVTGIKYLVFSVKTKMPFIRKIRCSYSYSFLSG